MRFPRIEILNEKEVQDIHAAALSILEEIGFKTNSSEIIGLARRNGLYEEGGVIRVSQKSIEGALSSAPSNFRLYNLSGSSFQTVGAGNTIFLSGHQAVFVLDYGTLNPRPGCKDDNIRFTRLVNAVEEIDGMAVQVYPQEVPLHSALVHAMEAMLTYSEKPLFFAPERKDAFEAVCKLARIASGNSDLGVCPFLIAQPSPISPLFWIEGSSECVIGAAREGIPCIVLNQIIPGMSGPVTLAGTLALHHAEAMIGLLITQLVNPGTPFIYPGAWVTFDMGGGGIDIGAPEKYLLSIASAQLAHYLGVPSMAAGPDTNSHTLDIQNGVEKSLSAASDILSGTDIAVNVGMFSNALTVSLEQVLIDADMISMLRRVCLGIEVRDDTIAFEAVKRVGIRGEFLTDPHTLAHFREELWDSRKSLFQRDKVDKWMASGAIEVAERAHARVEKILSDTPQPVLGEDQMRRMRGIVSEFENRYSRI